MPRRSRSPENHVQNVLKQCCVCVGCCVVLVIYHGFNKNYLIVMCYFLMLICDFWMAVMVFLWLCQWCSWTVLDFLCFWWFHRKMVSLRWLWFHSKIYASSCVFQCFHSKIVACLMAFNVFIQTHCALCVSMMSFKNHGSPCVLNAFIQKT